MMRSLYSGVAGLVNHQVRMDVLGNNIANVNTPGYRRRVVEFETLLAEALESGGRVDLAGLRPQIVRPAGAPVNANGNDVSMETEVGELIENASAYKVYLRLLAKVYHQMELAINQP